MSARELTPPSRTIVASRFGARAARVLLVLTLSGWLAWDCAAKSSGGGGGGRSYSSGRSSSSSSGGRSYSSGSSGSRSYSSGKSYGSGSSSGAGNSAGRSYSSGGNNRNSSTRPNDTTPPARNPSYTRPDSGTKPGSFSFDTAAARAQKEQASKRAFNQTQPPTTGNNSGSRLNDYSGSGRSFTRSSPPPLYVDRQLYTTRTIRINHYYQPYYSRPLVYYHDPYNSFFWWWLLDQSLDNRAMWAYSHRATMDDARYQALLAHDARLEAEIQRLEANQTPVNPAYAPPGLDRDLMYSDGYAQHAYQTRPTVAGRAFFRLFMIVTMLGVLWFFGWFIFCKRWN